MNIPSIHYYIQRIGLYTCLFVASAASAQAGEQYCYRVYLNSKGADAEILHTPERFLSPEALARRAKHGVAIAATDVPIAPSHLDAIEATGARIVTKSKWMATVVVESDDSLMADRLKSVAIVDSVRRVWKGAERLEYNTCLDAENTPPPPVGPTETDPYGSARRQLEMLNGIRLHALGKRGQGIRIAVIDAGFQNADRIAAFANLRLIGTHNAVFPGGNVYCDDNHGTKVLSCLAANQPGQMIGSAPEASYLLIKSEDIRTEYPVEEDYWAAALEYADSVGVDVISSSLGYSLFDTPDTVYRTADLDGKTAFITQAAAIAAEKGMLLVVSAGNEGNHAWEKITFPADATDVLTVGAVDNAGHHERFSSTGFTADYRVKPDVVALGGGTTVITSNGHLTIANGTSFATPLVAGLGACLWQALPWLSSREIITLIRQTASQALHPDAENGYGLPNIYKAYQLKINEPVQ